MRLRSKVDANQSELDAAMESMGWLVVPTHQLGNGFPDRLIAKAGRLVLVEVKDGRKPPSRRKLTEDEARMHEALERHGVRVVVVESVADLVQLDVDARVRFEGVRPRTFYPE